jgi:hypothetical protein
MSSMRARFSSNVDEMPLRFMISFIVPVRPPSELAPLSPTM